MTSTRSPTAARPDARSRALPSPDTLRDYSLLADGERGALMTRDGTISWLCFPTWSSAPLITSLLGMPGCYSVSPEGWHVPGGSYEPGTLIWKTRWTASEARLECRSALVSPGRPDSAVLLRRVAALRGRWRVHVTLHLAGDFGRDRGRGVRARDGVWTGRTADVWFRWSGGGNTVTRDVDGALHAVLVLDEGEHQDLMLELSTSKFEAAPQHSDELWSQTEVAWKAWVPVVRTSVAERDTRHSYAVLRGLTSPRTGALVAAATTSLPEHADAARDFDYRYAWIRDQCFAGQAMAAVDGAALLDDSVRFIGERLLSDGDQLSPVYTTSGERLHHQEEVDVPGYPGAPLVVQGNHAGDQFQLDAFGEALLLFGAAADVDRLNEQGLRAAEVAAQAIERRWQQPDAGIWEIDPRLWAHSRLVCAAGLRRMAGHMGAGASTGRWLALADTLVATTAARCTHPSGRWQRAPDDDRIDAALLVAQVRGAVPIDDPRSRLTLEAVQRELTSDGFLYRYRKSDQPLGEAEGAFLLCSYWMALACAQQGRATDAGLWFERARSACGPAALFCEEYDVELRELRGNLPQAFVHALLIETAATLAREP